MREIAEMTEHIVKKAKEYDRDTVPGDYATLATPCPNCGGVVKENYRRYTCTGKPGHERGLRLLVRQDRRPAARSSCRGRAVPARQADRPAGRLPLEGRLAVHGRDHAQVRRRGRRTGSSSSTSARTDTERDRRAGRLLRPGAARPVPEVRRPRLRARQQLRVRARGADRAQPTPTCDFKSGKIILQQPVDARADGEAAGDRQDRPARQVRLDAHAPAVQGVPGVGRGRRARSASSSTPSKFPRKGPAQDRSCAAKRPPRRSRRRRRSPDGRQEGCRPRAPRREEAPRASKAAQGRLPA